MAPAPAVPGTLTGVTEHRPGPDDGGSTDPVSAPTAVPAHAGEPGGAPPECSAKGCRRAARWALRWNNPRIHTPERRKTWTACDEHREHLAAFLSRRGLLRDVAPLTALDGDRIDPSPDGQGPDGTR